MPIYIWYPILASLTLGCIFMNIPPVGQQFMTLMNIDHGDLSLLLSGLSWTHALAQLPAGVIVDRLNPKTNLFIGLSICILANLIPLAAPGSFVLATAMRFFLGLGTSLAFLSIMKVIYILGPSDKLLSIQGWQGAGFSLGFVLPYLILPKLGPTAWQWSYLGCLILLTLSFGAAFMLPSLKAVPSQAAKRSPSEVLIAAKKICTSKAIWVIGIAHGLSYGSMNNLGNWLPDILSDMSGLAPSAWATATAMLLILGTMARAMAGKMAMHFSRAQVVNGAMLSIGLLYAVIGFTGNAWLGLSAALIMAFACGSTYGSVFTMSAGMMGAAYAATAMGVMNMIANLFNAVLTIFFGAIKTHTGQFGLSLLVSGLFGLFFWLGARKMITRIDRGDPKN